MPSENSQSESMAALLELEKELMMGALRKCLGVLRLLLGAYFIGIGYSPAMSIDYEIKYGQDAAEDDYGYCRDEKFLLILGVTNDEDHGLMINSSVGATLEGDGQITRAILGEREIFINSGERKISYLSGAESLQGYADGVYRLNFYALGKLTAQQTIVIEKRGEIWTEVKVKKD